MFPSSLNWLKHSWQRLACSYPWLLIFPMQSSSHCHFLSSFFGCCCVVIGPSPKPHTVFSSVVTNLLFTLFEWLFMHHIEVCCEYNKSRVHMITCCLHHCTIPLVCTVTCLISFRLTPNINNQGSKTRLPLAHHFSNHNGCSEDKRIADQVEKQIQLRWTAVTLSDSDKKSWMICYTETPFTFSAGFLNDSYSCWTISPPCTGSNAHL